MTTTMERNTTSISNIEWYELCRLTDLEPEWGEAALIDGAQVAVFRLWDDRVVVTSNLDPRTGSAVMARGIVGTRAGVPTVASPLHKEAYSLETGECFSNPELSLGLRRSMVVEGSVLVAAGQPVSSGSAVVRVGSAGTSSSTAPARQDRTPRS